MDDRRPRSISSCPEYTEKVKEKSAVKRSLSLPSAKKKKRRRRESSTSSSSSSSISSSSSSDTSTSSDSSVEERKRSKKKMQKSKKTKKKQDKKEKRRIKQLEKRLKKIQKEKERRKSEEVLPSPSVAPPVEGKVKTPLTKEEWEKRQSETRRVFDPDTGRTRLVRGDGEIVEEIVSRDRQREINKQATIGDGQSFQRQAGLLKR